MGAGLAGDQLSCSSVDGPARTQRDHPVEAARSHVGGGDRDRADRAQAVHPALQRINRGERELGLDGLEADELEHFLWLARLDARVPQLRSLSPAGDELLLRAEVVDVAE